MLDRPFLVLFVAAAALATVPAMASDGESGTCSMAGGEYLAHYRCPESFHLVYSTDGKTCSGGCYLKGDRYSLSREIRGLFADYGLEQVRAEDPYYLDLSEQLLEFREVEVTVGSKTLQIKVEEE